MDYQPLLDQFAAQFESKDRPLPDVQKVVAFLDSPPSPSGAEEIPDIAGNYTRTARSVRFRNGPDDSAWTRYNPPDSAINERGDPPVYSFKLVDGQRWNITGNIDAAKHNQPIVGRYAGNGDFRFSIERVERGTGATSFLYGVLRAVDDKTLVYTLVGADGRAPDVSEKYQEVSVLRRRTAAGPTP